MADKDDSKQIDPEKSAKDDNPQASLPIRSYLDSTVVPILLQGLSELSQERPGMKLL